jgi:hypothetical protein
MSEEQFTTNSIAGGSGELMIDKEKATAVVDINRTTGIPNVGGAVPGGRYHPARDRGDEVITTDTIARADMSLLEKHLGGRCAMERVDHRRPVGSLGYFTSCTK